MYPYDAAADLSAAVIGCCTLELAVAESVSTLETADNK